MMRKLFWVNMVISPKLIYPVDSTRLCGLWELQNTKSAKFSFNSIDKINNEAEYLRIRWTVFYEEHIT